MELEEYRSLKQQLRDQCEKAERNLAFEYAQSNNSVKVGDFVTDHIGTVKVELMRLYFEYGSGLPALVYSAPTYTKAGKPFKSESKRSVYQTNLIEEQ